MRNILPLSLLAGVTLVLGSTQATAFTLWPDTGRPDGICYATDGASVNCDGSEGYPGQDGAFTEPARSYTNNGDGTVTDNVTELMWQQDGQDAGNSLTHSQALTYIDGLNTAVLGGHDDWRLPTVQELITLVDLSRNLPSINQDNGFTVESGTNTDYPGVYWTSTDRATDSDQAWGVSFRNGNVGVPVSTPGFSTVSILKTTAANVYVRAVRGTEHPANLQDQGNGTLWDANTGLMWQQNSSEDIYSGMTLVRSGTSLSWGAASCTGDADTETNALCYCDSLERGGHTDWRLPDRNELLSAVDYTAETGSTAAIDPLHLNTRQGFYWTSSSVEPFTGNPVNAWSLNFTSGGSFADLKTNGHSAKCVRGREFQVDATNSDANITVSGATDGVNWVAYNTDQEVTLTAANGFTITDVIVDGASIGTQTSPYIHTFEDVAGNHTIAASTSTYSITVTVADGGTVTDVNNSTDIMPPGGTVSVIPNATQTFEVTADTGYSIGSVLFDSAAVTLDGSNQFTTPAITTSGLIFEANFVADGEYQLMVTLNGNGTGTVSSIPDGIACPGDCVENYADGTEVTLTATPDSGMVFAGWEGDCSGTEECTLTLDKANNVTAMFTQAGSSNSMLLYQAAINASGIKDKASE